MYIFFRIHIWGYQWDINGMSMGCQWDVNFQWDINGISTRYQWDINGMSMGCQWDISVYIYIIHNLHIHTV